VTAHRRQVEQTIEIVREVSAYAIFIHLFLFVLSACRFVIIEALLQEMNLLVQADQLGNPVDEYISKLSCILSEKAAGILQLQTRLAQFQKRLNERGVLVSSGV